MIFKVNSIFESISGEAGGFPQGTWATFIRLQGCNLMCGDETWECDTLQGQDSNGLHYKMSIPSILSMVNNKHVLITGGEPLLQLDTRHLIEELLQQGHIVQVETNGSRNLPSIPGVHWVMDRKGPSSGMKQYMIILDVLSPQIEKILKEGGHVYLKWVIASIDDIENMMHEMWRLEHLAGKVPFLISPVDAEGDMIGEILVEYIREELPHLIDNIIFSVQLHKIFDMP